MTNLTTGPVYSSQKNIFKIPELCLNDKATFKQTMANTGIELQISAHKFIEMKFILK